MVQAAACRVALYGFNSHPRLHNINTMMLLIVLVSVQSVGELEENMRMWLCLDEKMLKHKQTKGIGVF
jgi:hypothetical protein